MLQTLPLMGTRPAWLFHAVTALVLFLVLIPNLKPFSVASVSPPTLPHSWSYFLSDNEILILLELRGKKHWYKNKNKKLLLWLAPSTAISFLQTLPCLRWLLSTSLGQSMTKQKQQWSGLLSRHCRTSHASQGLPLEFLLSPAFNKCDCSPTSKAYCWP